ncbi:MAG: PQQ-binding-like beta-propeller repeat protein [Limisphaerales bacterium]
MKHLPHLQTPFQGRSVLSGLVALSTLWAVWGGPDDDWTNWRGPTRQGSTASTRTPTRWSASDVRWKLPLPGKGTSTPIVSGDRIYLTSPADGEDAVLSVTPSGEVSWQTKLGPYTSPKHATLASGCNASPVTDGRGVFVYFKSGNFAALELDGRIRWKQNLTERFGAERLFWDQGSSPVVTDRFVILSRMHQGDSWIAAFDKQTGELKWRQNRTFEAPSENDNGYATPVLYEEAGQPALLVWGADRLTSHRESDGAVLWTAEGFNPEGTGYWPAIATPVVAGKMVVVPVGRDDRPNQAHLRGIRTGGTGTIGASAHAWKRDDVGVFVTTPAVYGGKVYLLRHRGEVVCLDPETGRTLWTGSLPKSASPFYASPAIAGGVLHAAREDGVVFSARVGDRLELLSENPMGERIVATPVPAGGRLYLRGDRHLFCVDGK